MERGKLEEILKKHIGWIRSEDGGERADLSWANLSRANLSGANLKELRNGDLVLSQIKILPEGSLIGWKKCSGGVMIKLLIPAKAKRSNSTGRKCRAEYVRVLEVIGAEVGISSHDKKTGYIKGKTVKCDKWEEDPLVECGGGIHFFITRIEAENY